MNSFAQYLVRTGVITQRQLDQLDLTTPVDAAEDCRAAIQLGLLTPEQAMTVADLLETCGESSFAAAARQLGLLDSAEVCELAAVRRHGTFATARVCQLVLERGWATEGQLRVLSEHFRKAGGGHHLGATRIPARPAVFSIQPHSATAPAR